MKDNNENLCRTCKNPIDHDVKHVAYYYDGKPVYNKRFYSKRCKACIRSQFEEFKATLPETHLR